MTNKYYSFKIGAIKESFRKPLKKAAKLAREMGIDGLQLYVSNGECDVDKMTDKMVAKVRRILSRYALEISAFCGDMGGHGFMDAADNPRRIEKTKKMIDLAVKMNVKVITTHVGVIPEDDTEPVYKIMLDAMQAIGEYATEKGVFMAIETGPEPADVLRKFLDKLPVGIGVNLDPANLVMVAADDPVRAVKILGDRIVHTHAKDGVKLKKDATPKQIYIDGIPDAFKEVPLGEGDVPFKEYLQALKDIGFNGYLTIEREVGANPCADIGAAVEFLRDNLMTKKSVVYGVIGCGGIANGLHLPAIKALGNTVKLKYCCDLILERAEAAVKKYGISGYTKAITDYKEMLNDPELDAVSVCTHTHLHAPIAIEFMRAGKNALSEKPVAMSYEQALELAQVAAETNKVSNIGVCMRYDGAVNAIKSMVASGAIGDVYAVYCSFRSHRSIPGIGGEFTNKSHCGGGVLFDWGVHFLDLIMYILNSPTPLTASADTFQKLSIPIEAYKYRSMWGAKPTGEPVCDVEEYVTGMVRTESATISLNGCWAQNIEENEMFIDYVGTKGGIRQNYGGDFTYYFYDEKRIGDKFCKEKPAFQGGDRGNDEVKAFVMDILTGSRSREYIDNILPTALILDGLYRSAELREEVKLVK